MQNTIQISKLDNTRPDNKSKLSSNKLSTQLKNETDVAFHSVKIFCIKNCLWIIPLIIVVILIIIIDLSVTLFVWKNPEVLFEQIKVAAGYVATYILGLVTDHIRKLVTKN